MSMSDTKTVTYIIYDTNTITLHYFTILIQLLYIIYTYTATLHSLRYQYSCIILLYFCKTEYRAFFLCIVMYHLAKFVFHCDLEWRFCSTSFISTFGGLSISSISILRAYLAVTFAEVRLCSSLLLRVSSELRIDLFHTSGITKRRPSYVRKSTDKPYFC